MEETNIKHNKLSPGFFFTCLGLLITLITSVAAFLNLVFGTLDKKFPDVLNSTYQYGYSTYDFESIRFALAILIIFFPVFLVLSFFWKKFQKKELGHVDRIISKWLVYIILFLSALVVVIDLVTLVKFFVAGEITSRFAYKVAVTFLVAALVFKYFYVLEIWQVKAKLKKVLGIAYSIFAVLLVLGAVVYSFSVMGSPAKQRLLRLDDRRVNDLQSIQWQVISYWQQKRVLPEKLTDLANPMTGYSLPVDPEFQKGKSYEYIVQDKLKFELCADFSTAMPKGWRESGGYYGGRGIMPMMNTDVGGAVSVPAGGVNESWDHGAGRTCFTRTIDQDFYPPNPKPL